MGVLFAFLKGLLSAFLKGILFDFLKGIKILGGDPCYVRTPPPPLSEGAGAPQIQIPPFSF